MHTHKKILEMTQIALIEKWLNFHFLKVSSALLDSIQTTLTPEASFNLCRLCSRIRAVSFLYVIALVVVGFSVNFICIAYLQISLVGRGLFSSRIRLEPFCLDTARLSKQCVGKRNRYNCIVLHISEYSGGQKSLDLWFL